MATSTAREPAVSSQQLNLIAKASHSEVDELRKQLSTLSCELKASEEAQLVLKRRIRAAQLHSADTEQALNAMSEKVVAAQQARRGTGWNAERRSWRRSCMLVRTSYRK